MVKCRFKCRKCGFESYLSCLIQPTQSNQFYIFKLYIYKFEQLSWLERQAENLKVSSSNLLLNDVSLLRTAYKKFSFKSLLIYFTILNVSFHEVNAIFGFIVMLAMGFQLFSGLMLCFSLVTEPMLIPMVRDEEDIEDMYTDDFF